MKVHTKLLLAIVALCVIFASSSCSTVYRGLGIAPASDVESARAEAQALVKSAAKELLDVIEGRQTVAAALSHIAKQINTSNEDWENRPEPPVSPWVQIAAGLVGLALTGVTTAKMVNRSRDLARMERGEPVQRPKKKTPIATGGSA